MEMTKSLLIAMLLTLLAVPALAQNCGKGGHGRRGSVQEMQCIDRGVQQNSRGGYQSPGYAPSPYQQQPSNAYGR
jgi:hypothetical protein